MLSGGGRHGLPQQSARSLRGALETSEATDLCDICGFDTETDNLIVYCESCNMGVHQTCYGISEVTKYYDIAHVGHAPYSEDTHSVFFRWQVTGAVRHDTTAACLPPAPLKTAAMDVRW